VSPEAFYLLIQGEQRGPYTIAQIDHLLNSGLIREDAEFWREGLEDWQPVTHLVTLRNKPSGRRWGMTGMLAGILLAVALLGRLFGPIAVVGWRETAQYDFSERAAYWRARDIVRQKALPVGAVVNFAPEGRAEIRLKQTPPGATVRLGGEVIGDHGENRPVSWEVVLNFDPQLKQWSGVEAKKVETPP
jgi:hypothetical protein